MVKQISTIVMKEEDVHSLIVIAGTVAYRRALEGVAWPKVQIELIDALVSTTRPLTDEEQAILLP